MSGDWVDFGAVKAAVSLASVLKAYGIEGLRRSGPASQLRGRCPLHGSGGEDAFQASLAHRRQAGVSFPLKASVVLWDGKVILSRSRSAV